MHQVNTKKTQTMEKLSDKTLFQIRKSMFSILNEVLHNMNYSAEDYDQMKEAYDIVMDITYRMIEKKEKIELRIRD